MTAPMTDLSSVRNRTSRTTDSTTRGPLRTSNHDHVPVLDGLRGVAILLVLVVHLFRRDLISAVSPTAAWMAARFVEPARYGVELFFVLSGFLITGILLDTKCQRGFFVNFYARRTLRIFPLYYISLAVILGIVPLCIELDEGAKTIVDRQAWLWTYMADWPRHWIWDDSSTFTLGHFWSLAVEEHFYLLWPALVALLTKRQLFTVCAILIVMASGCRLFAWLFGTDMTPVFATIVAWPTLTKLDGLAVGAMIAITARGRHARTSPLSKRTVHWLIAAFGLVAAVLVMLPRRYLHSATPSVFTELAIVGFFACLLVRALRSEPGEWLHRVLSSPLLMVFGTYSYGIYVIHGILRPMLAQWFSFRGWPVAYGLPLAYAVLYYFAAGGAVFAMAYFSYHGMEKHFLALKRYFAPR